MRVLLLLLLLALPGLAQDSQYDGLTVLGAAPVLTDEEETKLTMLACHTKYKEPVVGMYFVNGEKEVRFYMNRTTWEKLKKDLMKARDMWSTLSAREFERSGTVEGYKIANKLATLRLSLQGETDLASKRVMMSATGGAENVLHIAMALREDTLKELIDNFRKVDQFLEQSAK